MAEATPVVAKAARGAVVDALLCALLGGPTVVAGVRIVAHALSLGARPVPTANLLVLAEDALLLVLAGLSFEFCGTEAFSVPALPVLAAFVRARDLLLALRSVEPWLAKAAPVLALAASTAHVRPAVQGFLAGPSDEADVARANLLSFIVVLALSVLATSQFALSGNDGCAVRLEPRLLHKVFVGFLCVRVLGTGQQWAVCISIFQSTDFHCLGRGAVLCARCDWADIATGFLVGSAR